MNDIDTSTPTGNVDTTFTWEEWNPVWVYEYYYSDIEKHPVITITIDKRKLEQSMTWEFNQEMKKRGY